MSLDPAIATVLGAAVGGGFVVFGQWIARHQENKRALTEIAIKTAIENWRQVAERTDRYKVPMHDYGPNPMDGYLIRTLALIEILQRRKFSPEDLHKRLTELEAIGKVLDEHLSKRRHEKTLGDPNKAQ